MDRKTIIAFSFATNRLGAGFVGLVYYNPEIHNDNYNHINIPKLGHYIHEHNVLIWVYLYDYNYHYGFLGYSKPIRQGQHLTY